MVAVEAARGSNVVIFQPFDDMHQCRCFIAISGLMLFLGTLFQGSGLGYYLAPLQGSR